MPRCRNCKKHKDKSEMASDKRIARGHTTICKLCDAKSRSEYYQRNKQRKQDYDLQRNYGITLAEYDMMLARQGGRCALCGTTDCGQGKGRFAVDHCHTTSQVRALLCHKCNMGIGLLSSPQLLRKAAKYLEAFE